MKKTALLVGLGVLAGCSTDSANSLSRDYRNLNNEAIDALMLITGESRARFAQDKIFKPYRDRLGKIDDRVGTWLQNTEDDDILKDMLSSESVAVLIAECTINQKRLKLEVTRLKKLVDAKLQENPGADASKEWPNLAALAEGSTDVQNNLEKNKFVELLGDLELARKRLPLGIDAPKEAMPKVGAEEQGKWKNARGKIPDFKAQMFTFTERVCKLGQVD